MLTTERSAKVEDLVRWRQFDLTVVLENVHDPHNLGAIIRTCDAAGIGTVHVIYSQEGENSQIKYVGKRASRGAAKWVDVLFYKNVADCVQFLRDRQFRIYATHLGVQSQSVYDLDLTQSVAIVFGNEKDGISKDLLSVCDGNISIPMFGMVQSLNVSNAAAVILFEIVRQRIQNGSFDRELDSSNAQMMSTFREYIARTRPRIARRKASMIDDYVSAWVNHKKPE